MKIELAESLVRRGRTTRALLVRVGADLTAAGGGWNGPVDPVTGEFVYAAILESAPVRVGLEQPYAALCTPLKRLGWRLPAHLEGRRMHLDPDFERLTYGDQGEGAKQIKSKLEAGDVLVFYAGLKPINGDARLIYALIGMLTVAEIVLARDLAKTSRDANAHPKTILSKTAADIVVRGHPVCSGRFARALPVSELRNRAYRLRDDLLNKWGGVAVRDPYLQRSARLPELRDARRFLVWLREQNIPLLQTNN